MSYYNVRDKNGKFTSNLDNFGYRPAKITKVNKQELVNHIAIVLDCSSSMTTISKEVVEQLHAQIETIKKNARSKNQKTYISLYTFSTCVSIPEFFEIEAEKTNLNAFYYRPNGMTALFDAVGQATTDLTGVDFKRGNKDSFLVITITDGQENQSRKYNSFDLQKLLKKNQSTDRWSFAFLVPDYCKQTVLNFGIPEGNIQVWESTRQGTYVATSQATSAISQYYTTRSQGLAATQSYFVPDLTNVSATKMQRNLEDSSKDFLRLMVTEPTRIDEFVKKTTGNNYVIGSGYYQLTKSEKVHEYKGIIIQDKNTNKLYAGRDGEELKEVRRMLKLPTMGHIRLHKGDSNYPYNIFVKSTSVNRKLLPGTVLLLDKELI